MQGKRMETGVCAVRIVCILNIFPGFPVGGCNLQRFPCICSFRTPPFPTSRVQSEKHCREQMAEALGVIRQVTEQEHPDSNTAQQVNGAGKPWVA